MFASNRRTLLLCGVGAFALLGSTALAATGSSGSSGCAPAAFTGSVRAHSAVCVPKIPISPGLVGPRGPRGVTGAAGRDGSVGRRGPRGPRGAQGQSGIAGLQGNAGVAGSLGATGGIGGIGPAGPAGVPGATGPAASSAFAEFFALMPPDNAATVAPGTAVTFPQDGPTSGTIVRLGASTFDLPNIGTYRVAFSVSVTEAGQLVLDLNGAELAYTVYGRATGTSQIAGVALVTTATVNSVLAIHNPAGESTALTITPLAGGTDPAVASLVIDELN